MLYVFGIKHCFLNVEQLASTTSLELPSSLAAYALKMF